MEPGARPAATPYPGRFQQAGKHLQSVFRLLFPPHCAGCNRIDELICADCLSEMAVITGQRCERCGAPGWEGSCPTCREKTPAFTSVTAPFLYDGMTRQLILNFKYRNQPDIGPLLADAALDQLASWNCGYDALCEVPMHRASQRKRGYNQSRILARRFSERLGLPLAPVGTLTKTRGTPHQAAQDVTMRWENVKDAFTADPEQVKGRSILIVDDVCTTGATLHFCAEALVSAGATEAGCLTLARTDLQEKP